MSDFRIGIFLASSETPMITTMGRYHPEFAPQDCDLGPADDADTWFEAYSLQGSVAEARITIEESARDMMALAMQSHPDTSPDLDLSLFRATPYVVSVSKDGDLLVAGDPIDLDALASDADLRDLFLDQEQYENFTRDEVYGSHGAVPRFAEDAPEI